jgi:Zn-dependent alcohol dehydrogenase
LNLSGEDAVYQGESGDVAGLFFRQSSFAGLAIVQERSVVDVSELVKGEEELKLFSPMGCGFQTGAGTVAVLAKAGKVDSVVVM